MVTQMVERQPHYDSDTGEWDGQLAAADILDQLPPPTERKPGGPMDRTTWIAMSMPHLSGAGFKFLSGLNVYANAEGRCWPSQTTLRRITGLSDGGLRNGQREAVKGDWIEVEINGKGRHSTTYRMTGWQSEWKDLPVSKPAKIDTLPVKDCGAEGIKSDDRTLSSSNPERLTRNTNGNKADSPKAEVTSGSTTRGFSSFSLEEEGVTRFGETLATAVKEPASTNEQCAAAWVEAHLPDAPMESQISRLLRHCWSVWEYPANPYGWKHGIEAAIKTCTKDMEQRRKFRRDVVQHLAKVGLPEIGPDGKEAQPTLICDRCGVSTTSYEYILTVRGNKFANGCADCPPFRGLDVYDQPPVNHHLEHQGMDTVYLPCTDCGTEVDVSEEMADGADDGDHSWVQCDDCIEVE